MASATFGLATSEQRVLSEGDGTNIAVIVGPAVGGVVLVVLLVWCCCRRRKTRAASTAAEVNEPAPSQRRRTQTNENVQVVAHNDYIQVERQVVKDLPPPKTELSLNPPNPVMEDEQDEVATEDVLHAHRLREPLILLEQVLGRGTYGEVILGHYNQQLVAVKRLRPDHNTPKNIASLLQEIQLMTRFNSPYLVHFIGATWENEAMTDLMCVVEYMEQRDLQSYLARTKDRPKSNFPWKQKLSVARHMALALVYLHDQKVIHRDLKSPNVFLNQTMDAKLGDFGIARHVVEKSMSNAVGSYRWTAPEVLKGKYYSVKADIYSFGVVLSELDTHVVPYAGMVNEKGQELGNFTIMFQSTVEEHTRKARGCRSTTTGHQEGQVYSFKQAARPSDSGTSQQRFPSEIAFGTEDPKKSNRHNCDRAMPPSTLKVLIVGPKEGGKTAISNFLSDNTDRLGNQDKYQPTIGVRILECEKSNGRTQANVELWDCSGDQIYEACWPAILKDANATVIVYNPESHVHESEVTLWYEWFVQNAALDQAQCLVLAHTPGKSTASRGKVNLPPTLKTVQTTYESPGLLKAEFEAFLFSVADFVQRQARSRK
ncbi:unnamed protein product [Aphanomyces euteiches]